MTRPPIRHACDWCGTHPARFYVVHDRLLTLCGGCWHWDVLNVLDTMNIPDMEEPSDVPSDVR